MKIFFNSIQFKQGCTIVQKGENKVFEYFDENERLIKTYEQDKFERDIDTKTFDKEGNITSHLHKDYTENGFIETFKNKYQEYTRIFTLEKKGEYIHRIEKFMSKTSPDKNYITEFIKDTSNNLLRIITNGKVIELKK